MTSTKRTQGEDRKNALHGDSPLVRSRLTPRTLRAGVTPWQMMRRLNVRQDPSPRLCRRQVARPGLSAPVCPDAVLRTRNASPSPALPALLENPIQPSHDLASPRPGISPADATHKGTQTFAQDVPCGVVYGAQNWFNKYGGGGLLEYEGIRKNEVPTVMTGKGLSTMRTRRITTEHDEKQGQTGVKKTRVHIQEIQTQAQTGFCMPRTFLKGDA